jgi:predicted peptidase
MLGEKEGFIVVAPDLKSTQGILPKIRDVWIRDMQRDDRIILAVRDEVCRQYNIDRRRILLTGFSSGGYPMYWTGLHHPDKFNAVIARSCNSDDRIFESLDPQALKTARKIPVVIFVGKDEPAMQDDAWLAFRWLRRNGWDSHNCIREEFKGGHLRRPERAYAIWKTFGWPRQGR